MPTSMLSVSHLQRQGLAPQQICSRRHSRRASTVVVSVIGLLLVVAAVVTPGPGAFAGARADIANPRLHSIIAARAEAEAKVSGPALEELEVGQRLTCKTVKRFSWDGYKVDIGAQVLGHIEMGEIQEGGYPSSEILDKLRGMKNADASELNVRVLDKSRKKLYLTMLPGDLTRPERKKNLPRKGKFLKAFMDVGPEEWLEGEVVSVNIKGAMVLLVHPKSGKKINVQLSKDEFTESFFKECTRGAKVRVRISGLTGEEEKKELVITMKEPAA